MIFAYIIETIGSLSNFLPIIVFLKKRKEHKEKLDLSLILFIIYICIATVSTTINFILGRFGINNIMVIRIYLIFELPLLGSFLLSLFMGKKAFKWWIQLIFVLIPTINNIIFFDLSIVPYKTIIINLAILSFLSVFTVKKVGITETNMKNVWYYYMILGILIYAANNAIVYGFISLGIFSVFYIHTIINIIQNILFTIGVSKYFTTS